MNINIHDAYGNTTVDRQRAVFVCYDSNDITVLYYLLIP